MLTDKLRKRIARVVLEHAKRGELIARGLRPARKLLFTGLPGTGKTMGAGAIARAIRLPMFRVETQGVFSSLFAESAQRLAKVFDFVRLMPAVYLFDEFDSIGAERSDTGSKADGGEARRVTNVLLQCIEGDQSNSMIIAASNHAGMLDSAIFRRFDEMIVFDPLTKDEIAELVRRKLVGFEAEPLDFDAIFKENESLGHADLCAALERACKDQVLEGLVISTASIIDGIANRTRMRDDSST